MSLPVFYLSSLDGRDGFRLDGKDEFDQLGVVVGSAGDINGDGFDDVIVTSYRAGYYPWQPGASYVVFGKASGFDSHLDVADLDGSNGFRVERYQKADGVGDINGDGYDDLMVFGFNHGVVVFGKSTGFDASLDFYDLDGNNGFALRGSKSDVGPVDINGDGFDDVIVEAAYYDPDNYQFIDSSYVVFGHAAGFDQSVDLPILDGNTGFRMSDTHDSGRTSVTGTSDINGDGLDDLFVTILPPRNTPYSYTQSENYVIYGKTSGFAAVEDPSDLDARDALHLDIDITSARSAGDINGDGFDDLILINANDDNSYNNYVIFGKASGIDLNQDLSQLDGNSGFKMQWHDFMSFLHSAGDVNGDGFDDLIVGLRQSDMSDTFFAGSSFVLLGHASAFDAVVDVLNLDSDSGVNLHGGIGEDIGYAVSGVGDINNDGFDDVIIGAPFADPNGSGSGASYVLMGSSHLKETQIFAGTPAHDELSGSAALEYFQGGEGDDTIFGGGGADLIHGGDGNDMIWVPDLDFPIAVSGEAGEDTLAFTRGGANLHLNEFDGWIKDVEIFDLTGSGDNTLTLNAQNVLNLSTTDTLVVKGDLGDRVDGLKGWLDEGIQNGMHVLTKHGAKLLIDTSVATDPQVVPSVLDLSSLNGINGFRLDGTSFDRLGTSVSVAGDVNADGYSDLIIGAPEADPNGSRSGSSYVLLGKESGFDAQLDLSNLDNNDGFRLDGSSLDQAGVEVSDAGDVNWDGYDDVIIWAPGVKKANEQGVSYVVFGGESGIDTHIDLSNLDGSNGFRLEGVTKSTWLHSPVSSAGDANGDGYDDLLVVGNREVDVVFGTEEFDARLNLSSLNGYNGFRLRNGFGLFGDYAVSNAGDVNGDGYDDIIIGSMFDDKNDNSNGISYVVFCNAFGGYDTVDLASLDGSNGFRLVGAAGDRAGNSVSSAGDINGDGFDDVIVGAPNASLGIYGSGTSYVVFGKGSDFDAELNLDTLDGSNGFQLTGTYLLDRLGFSVSGAGDVNGDGFDDVVVTGGFDNFISMGGNYSYASGLSYVVFGKEAGFDAKLDVSSLDGSNGVILKGLADEQKVSSVSGAGDINGDGFDDLIVGAPGTDLNGDSSGSSYVIFGSSDFGLGGKVQVFHGTEGDDTFKGSDAAEHFIAGDGSDNLLGRGGADIFDAGAGDDAIRIGDLTFALIDGGEGNDALHLAGSYMELDLTELGDRIRGIETICLYGRGDNTLILTAETLLALSDSTNILKVNGDIFDNISVPEDGWVDGGSRGFYHTYTHGDAVLLVGANVTVDFFW